MGRFYGAEASSGKLTLVITVMAILTIIGNFGIKDALQKLIPESNVKHNQATTTKYYLLGLKNIFLIWFVVGSIFWFLAPVLCKAWNAPELLSFFRISILFVLPTILGDYNYFSLRAALKINTANISILIPSVIRIVILIVVTIYFFNIDNPIYLHWATLSILPFLFSIYPIYKNFFKSDRIVEHTYIPKSAEIYRLAIPMLLTYSAFMINNYADVFMLKFYNVSTAAVGVYKTANNISMLTATLLVALNTTVQPKITQLYYQSELDEVRKVSQKSTKLIFWLSLPITLLLIFIAKPIMSIYGKEFMIGAFSLAVLSIGQLFNTACGPVAQLLNGIGFHKQFTIISIIGAIINIVINLILIPLYGINGAAIASTISIFSWNIIGSFFIKKKLGFYIAFIPFKK
ncbi:MAG: polysaccharide biosynthesis C-terminal domain-containing protein [Chitinophagales bacterium]